MLDLSGNGGLQVVSRPSWRGASLLYAIRKLGLGADLQLCLDAGASESYPGSGQTWADLSGNGYDFHLGATSGSEASDPTFNGTAGRLSDGEYWSFDGGDIFTLGQSNPTWVQNLHKAGAAFTLAAMVQIGGTGAQQMIAGSQGGTAGATGFLWGFQTTERQRLQVVNAGAVAINSLSGTGQTLGTGQWAFSALSVDEAAPLILHQLNAQVTSAASGYSSPATGDATTTFSVGSLGAGGSPLTNGSRLGFFAAWSRALPQGELSALFNAMRGRFGV